MRGILGLLVLVLDVWAIVKLFETREKTEVKAIWTAVIIFLPGLGFILWWFAGPGKKKF